MAARKQPTQQRLVAPKGNAAKSNKDLKSKVERRTSKGKSADKAKSELKSRRKTTRAMKKSGEGMSYAGGSKNFNEKAGEYKKGTAPRSKPGSGRTPKKRRVMKKK